MENNDKPIYLDQEGYEKYLKEIEDLKVRIHENDGKRSSAFHEGASDGWSSSDLSEVERVDIILSSQIKSMIEGLKRIVIVKKLDNDDIIEIGDTCSYTVNKSSFSLIIKQKLDDNKLSL